MKAKPRKDPKCVGFDLSAEVFPCKLTEQRYQLIRESAVSIKEERDADEVVIRLRVDDHLIDFIFGWTSDGSMAEEGRSLPDETSVEAVVARVRFQMPANRKDQ
jgi:hypothetical protein